MQCVKEYRIKENVKVKYYSDFEMYRKMFFMLLDMRYESAERQRKNGTLLDFDVVMEELLRDIENGTL